jgi:DtxR family transcriptional regulator, manganese transport regulator
VTDMSQRASGATGGSSTSAKRDPITGGQATSATASDLRQRAESHRRTRRDHTMETAEDYVEAVADILQARGTCRVVDLAQHFAVSHVTVTKIVARLQEEELLSTQPYRPIELTAKGKRLAAKSRERHEIVYRFLLAIGVDPATAASDAEGLEHHVSPTTLRCFAEFTAQQASE